jgi:TetR/AcrR family tetracycline transcriptional repressor
MKIEQGQIIREALALLEERGLDQLNMRALADRLGVKASAIYWHIANKAELIELMTKSFYKRAADEAEDAANWRDWLISFGQVFHAIIRKHRDGARLCAMVDPGRERLRVEIDLLASPLREAGVDRDLSVSYEAAVIAISLGFAVLEQSRALHDLFEEDIAFQEAFDRGLKAMVAGFPEPNARNGA